MIRISIFRFEKYELQTLVDIAWTFYMLHENMQANFFLQNMENSGSLRGNIL